MQTYNEIVIFGLGGIGSWIAEYIRRSSSTELLRLVDFDVVEHKNLNRQNYGHRRIGEFKSQALKENMENITQNEEMTIIPYNRKVIDEIDMELFNKNALAIITTDNISSKRLIAKHFRDFIIVNCDKNFVEIKNFLDETDNKAWDVGGGYSNNQDILSNLYGSYAAFAVISQSDVRMNETFCFKVKNEDDILELVSGNLKGKKEEQNGN